MFENIHKAIVAGYKDDRPLWMSSPESSTFYIISKHDFERKTDQEIQDIFRRRHILVHDQFKPTLAFDEKGLKTLGDFYKSVTIQGEHNAVYICTV